MGVALPAGTVTLLFTDIERSTRRWEEREATMPAVLDAHDRIIRSAVESWRGVVFKHTGDGMCSAFSTATDAVGAAVDAQRALAAEPWADGEPLRVRMAVHTGAPIVRDNDYSGPPLNRVARLLGVAHAGQVIVSAAAADLVVDALPNGVTLHDLGEHALRDLARSERIYQVRAPGLGDDFPALLSQPMRTARLPAVSNPFVGRFDEVVELEALVRTHSLVVITGPGGCGKTRIAVELAGELGPSFADGVVFVDLSAVSEDGAVASTAAGAAGITLLGGVDPIDVIAAELARREQLLVLDNCEHLVDACAQLCDAVLSRGGASRIVATSREPLAVIGEHVFALHPLADASAVELFAERAASVRPGFVLSDDDQATVREICQRLDGLPLAIELAAARTGQFSVQQIASRLDDRFRLLAGARRRVNRQATLRAAMDWSYDLLRDDEKATLRALSVFAGTFPLEAAVGVVGDASGASDAADVIASLVARSLLVADFTTEPPRYRLLETVRAYASERLVADGEAETVRARHRDWFLTWAQSFDVTDLMRAAPVGALFREVPDIRAAITWSLDVGDNEIAARLLAAIAPILPMSMYWLDGLQLGREVVGRGVFGDPDVEVVCRWMLASVAMTAADSDIVELAWAATQVEGTQQTHSLAHAWMFLALTLSIGAAVDPSLTPLVEDATARAHEIAATLAPLLKVPVLIGTAMAVLDLGEIERAKDWLEEAVAILSAESDLGPSVIPAHAVLAVVYHLLGRYEDAVAQWMPLLARPRSFVSGEGDYVGRFGMALAMSAVGDVETAAAVMRETIAMLPSVNVPLVQADVLYELGAMAASHGDDELASRLLAAGYAQGKVHFFAFRSPMAYALYKHYTSLVRARLGADKARVLRAEGQALSYEAALALAGYA